MRLIVFLFVFLLCHTVSAKTMVDELAQGFVRAIDRESNVWYECGRRTPRKQWLSRSEKLAQAVLSAMGEYDLKVNPWGVMATIYKESRGNRCSIGPNPRKIARKYKLVADKPFNAWTEEEITSVLKNRKFGRRLADLGLGQVVWKKFARIKDKRGTRIPTIKEMLDLDNGARIVVLSMKHRRQWKNLGRFRKMPWLVWRESAINHRYAADLRHIVKKMGGPYQAILGR